MKRLLLSAALMFSALPAHADGLALQGLDDPEVTAPARAASDWNGVYIGVMGGRSGTETSETKCFKLGDERDCSDPVFVYYPEYLDTRTFTTGSETTEVGAFAGYRHEIFGNMVAGFEVGAIGDYKSAEGQIGLDLGGRALVYGLAGFGDNGTDSGEIYGAGIDVKVGKRLLIGVKHTTDMTTARIGIQF